MDPVSVANQTMMRIRSPIAWPLIGYGFLAHHEAGHIVVARELGIATGTAKVTESFGLAEIGLGTRPASPIKENATPKDQPPGLAAAMFEASYPQHWPNRTKQEAGVDYATMLTAGRQAELIKARVNLAPGEFLRIIDSDHQQANEILQHLKLTRHALGYCQQKARQILLERWDAVQLLAAQLQEGAA